MTKNVGEDRKATQGHYERLVRKNGADYSSKKMGEAFDSQWGKKDRPQTDKAEDLRREQITSSYERPDARESGEGASRSQG